MAILALVVSFSLSGLPATQQEEAPTITRVRVVDLETNEPLPEVLVQLYKSRFKPSRDALGATTTDAEGYFELTHALLDSGRFDVVIRHGGYAPVALSVRKIDKVDPKPIALIRGSEVRVRVVRADGTPAVGEAVVQRLDTALGRHGPSYVRPDRYSLDEEGRFVAWVPGGVTRIVVLNPDGQDHPSEIIPLPAADELVVNLPDMAPRSVATLRVRDSEGQPIREAVVSRRRLGEVIGNTDAEGLFPIPMGTDRVFLFHLEYAPIEVELDSAATGVVDATMARGRVVQLEVLDVYGERVETPPQIECGGVTDTLHLVGGRWQSGALPEETASVALTVPNAAKREIAVEPGSGLLDLGTIRMELGTGVDLILTDGEGEAVSGARVTVKSRSLTRSTLSRPDGLVRIGGLPPGPMVLRFRSDQHLSHDLDVVLEEGMTHRESVVLLRGGTLTGRVIGTDGEGIESARVTVQLRSGEAGTHLRTLAQCDEDGYFTLNRVPLEGLESAVIRGPGYRTVTVPTAEVTDGEHRDLGEITLGRGASVTGRVLDTRGEPCPEAVAWLRGEPNQSLPVDANGRFEIRGVAEGEYQIEVSLADAFATDRSSENDDEIRRRLVVVGAPVDETFVFQRGMTRTLEVVEHESRRPLSNVKVTLDSATPDGSRRAIIRTTDAEGRVEFRGLFDGPVTLRVEAAWATSEAAFGSVALLPEDVELPRGAKLIANIDGSQATGPERVDLRVRTQGREVRSVAFVRWSTGEGVALFHDLPPGEAELTFHARDYEPIESQTLELSPRGVTVDLRFVPLPRHDFTIEVRNELNYEPVAGAAIRIGRELVRTDSDGLATLAVRGQPERLAITADGFLAETVVDPLALSGAPLEVLLLPAASLGVELRDENGKPSRNARCTLAGPIGSGVNRTYRAVERTDGVYHFDELAEGDYLFIVRRRTATVVERFIPVFAGEHTTTSIRVRPGFEVAVKVLIAGAPVRKLEPVLIDASSGATFRGNAFGYGEYQFELRNEGEYRLRVLNGAATMWEQPETVRLDVDTGAYRLELPTVRVTGKLDAPDDRSLAGLGVRFVGPATRRVWVDDDGSFAVDLFPSTYMIDTVAKNESAQQASKGVRFAPQPLKVEEPTQVVIEGKRVPTVDIVAAVPIPVDRVLAYDMTRGFRQPLYDGQGTSFRIDGDGRRPLCVYAMAGPRLFVAFRTVKPSLAGEAVSLSLAEAGLVGVRLPRRLSQSVVVEVLPIDDPESIPREARRYPRQRFPLGGGISMVLPVGRYRAILDDPEADPEAPEQSVEFEVRVRGTERQWVEFAP